MEHNGHVVSRMDEKNKHNKIIELTQLTLEMGADMVRNIKRNEEKMLSPLSASDAERLRDMLTTIDNNLE